MRKHQTARFVAILIIVMAFICLLGGLAASLLVSRVGLGAGWGSGSKVVLLLPVILGSFLTFVAMLLLGAILFFLVEIDNNLSALRGRIPKAAAPAETALPTPEETMPEAPATVPAVVPGGVPAFSYDEAMARVRAREAVIAASAGAAAPAVTAGPAGGGGVGLAGAALAVAAVAAVAGHEGGETKLTEAAREVEVTLPSVAAAAHEAVPQVEAGTVEPEAAVEGAAAGVEEKLVAPAVEVAAAVAPEAATEADLGVAEAAAVEAVTSGEAAVEALPSEAEAAIEAVSAEGEAVAAGVEEKFVAPMADEADVVAPETVPDIEVKAPEVPAITAPVEAAGSTSAAVVGAGLAIAGVAALAGHEGAPEAGGGVTQAVEPPVQEEVPVPAVAAAIAAARASVIREAEAASEVVETPDVTVLSPEVVEPAAGQVVAGAVDVPSVEVTVAEPSTAELVARSLANGPIPSEPASAGAVVVPDLEAEVVAAEPALQARAFEVEAQAPQVEISEFAADAPAEAAMAGAAAAERLAPVATHVEANAEETVGEVWPGGPVEAVVAPVLEPTEAEMPPVVTEIPEAVAPEFAVMAPAETEATEDTATETPAMELEVAGPEAEVAPAEPEVAPPDEELGQLRSQFAALESGISGLEKAMPAPRLPGSEEAARIAAEMAALKPAPLAAPAKEGRERKPAKLTSRLTYVEGIGEESAAKLEEIGIGTPEALLARGATLKGRQEIAEQSGLSDKLILKWVNHADMFRVSGIGSEYADLLEAAGVDTVVELASRVPANLHARLVATNQEKKLVRQMPVLWQVERWVALAKALPRVVTY